MTTSFLGAISRLTIDSGDLTLVAQIPRTRVAGLGAGDKVHVTIDAGAGAGGLRLVGWLAAVEGR